MRTTLHRSAHPSRGLEPSLLPTSLTCIPHDFLVVHALVSPPPTPSLGLTAHLGSLRLSAPPPNFPITCAANCAPPMARDVSPYLRMPCCSLLTAFPCTIDWEGFDLVDVISLFQRLRLTTIPVAQSAAQEGRRRTVTSGGSHRIRAACATVTSAQGQPLY